jgi:hypothetical protein
MMGIAWSIKRNENAATVTVATPEAKRSLGNPER